MLKALSSLLILMAVAVPAFAQERVARIKVLADKAPDCSSLKSIIDTVTRGCTTNDEKAIALYNFMLLTHYHAGYPGEPGGLGALKEINVYGWSLCGGLHTVEAALWKEMGWEWRYVGWSNPGHTTVEARYDGRWHYLDVFLKYWTWIDDPNAPGGRTIASEEDIKANPKLVTDDLVLDEARKVYFHAGNRFENIDGKANWRAPAFLVCGDTPDGILSGIKSSKVSGSPTGWSGLKFDSPGYATDVNLSPGYSLTLDWSSIKDAHWWNGRKYTPGHSCGDKDYRNCPSIGPVLEPYRDAGGQRRGHANGRLLFAPDLSNGAFLRGLNAAENVKLEGAKLIAADAAKPASITVELQSPYIMSRASGAADGAESAEISVDGGKTYKPIKLEDFSEQVGGQYACLVRLTFRTLASLKLEAIVQHNRCALPYLSPGRNRISVNVADATALRDGKLIVTYAYNLGSRNRSYEALADMGAEVARGHQATWSDVPVVVQKTFDAKDLPAEFEIDVPTPKDKHPVYPRMLFLRREVISGGSKPLPLPANAVEPRIGPNDELKELPSPFTVGIAKPPAKVVRATEKRTYELALSHAVSADGQAADNHFLKTKPGETWAIIVKGDLSSLPKPGDIASARLLVPVIRSHDKGATKMGVTLLAAPAEPGKPLDFAKLGEVIGTANIPRQPTSGDYAPPKPFATDITRALKMLAAGEARFHGFAIRTVPDRGVDEGWITRLDLPAGAKVTLEVEVYRP